MADEVQATELTADQRNMGLLLWIGSIFFGFIPGLILFLAKKDDPYVQDQAKEALNWGITAAIGWIVGCILLVIIIGIIVLLAVWAVNIVFCILGAIAASKGNASFRVPFAIRLIK